MTWRLLSPDMAEAIHDAILNAREFPGRAGDKSLESALARVDNWLAYDMIRDTFDLSAAYAVAIARGHCFNDGKKRTAYRAMFICLDLNGVGIAWDMKETGDTIIRVAQGVLDECDLADWLRGKVG